jgi:hypothetical protein
VNRKRLAVYCAAGVSAAVIAILLLTSIRARQHPDRAAGPTTSEGEWEVPIVEGDRQLETYVLAKNKLFRLRVEETVWEFHEGDSVTVRWEPGKVFVNDVQIVPDPNTRIELPVADVMMRYGDIPIVQEYIAEHRGEASEDEVATRAMEAWFEKKQQVLNQAWERYMEVMKRDSPRQAAEAAGQVLRESGIADSVAVMRGSPPESEAQDLDVIWKGERGKPGALVLVSLRPWRRELPPTTVTAKRVYAELTGELNRLRYGENTLAVRFEGGALMLEGNVIANPEGGKQ